MTPTKSRQNADASLTTRRTPSLTLTPMSNPATASIPFRHLRVLAASLALALAGCATPVLKPALDVPDRFAAATASETSPRSPGGKASRIRCFPISSAAQRSENRDVKIAAERVRAARAGETISRSWLLPSVSVGGAAFDHKTDYDSAAQATSFRSGEYEGGADRRRRVLGSRPLRSPARGRRCGRGRHAGRRRHGARGVRLLVLSDVATNYFTLVGALRQLETVRAISAAQDETLRLVTARQRAGLATPFDVERAQTEASRARAAIPPLETLAAVSRHRIAVLIGDQAFNAASIAPSTRRRRRSAGAVRASRPTLLQRRPDLLAASAQLDAANARRQQADGGVVPAAFSRRRVRSRERRAERRGPWRRALHQRRGAAGDADLQRRTHAGDQRHRRERPARSACCATRTRSCARSRTSRTRSSRSRDERQRAQALQTALPRRPTRRSAARNRSTTAARSICCRCSMRSARAWPCASAPTTATRNCCSTACSCTRRSAVAGRCSSPSPSPLRPPTPQSANILKLRPLDTRNRRENVSLPRIGRPSRSDRRRCPVRVHIEAARRSASRRSHRRDPLRQDAGNEPLRRHRAVAPRSRPGISRRRQGRAAQGRRRPESARGRRAGRARRHRLPAGRGSGAAAARRRHDAGAAGRVGSAAAQRA